MLRNACSSGFLVELETAFVNASPHSCSKTSGLAGEGIMGDLTLVSVPAAKEKIAWLEMIDLFPDRLRQRPGNDTDWVKGCQILEF